MACCEEARQTPAVNLPRLGRLGVWGRDQATIGHHGPSLITGVGTMTGLVVALPDLGVPQGSRLISIFAPVQQNTEVNKTECWPRKGA